EQVLVRLDGGARVDTEAGARPGCPDGPQRAHGGLRGFRVDGDAARPRLRVGGGVPVRVFDHQVAVDGQRGVLEQRLDDRRPRVRLGTKWLSITSTCSQSAVSSTALASSASRAK